MKIRCVSCEPTRQRTGKGEVSPMATISGDEYSLVLKDRQDLQQKLEAAASESDFLSTYYARMLRACEVAYQQAVNANVVLERQERRKAVKEKREALKARKKAEKG